MKDVKSVCVFCASSPHVSQIYKDEAFELGQLLARRGIRLVTGGGCMGLMASAEDGAMSCGGDVTAIIPQFMVAAGWLHKGIDDVHITSDMQERKRQMLDESDAVIVLPGGCGTLDEAMEVLTLKQLGLFSKPVVFLNTNGFYDLMTSHLQRLADEGFMKPEHIALWSVADTPADAVRQVFETPEWDISLGKLPQIN